MHQLYEATPLHQLYETKGFIHAWQPTCTSYTKRPIHIMHGANQKAMSNLQERTRHQSSGAHGAT
jgi:hypothetical protein